MIEFLCDTCYTTVFFWQDTLTWSRRIPYSRHWLVTIISFLEFVSGNFSTSLIFYGRRFFTTTSQIVWKIPVLYLVTKTSQPCNPCFFSPDCHPSQASSILSYFYIKDILPQYHYCTDTYNLRFIWGKKDITTFTTTEIASEYCQRFFEILCFYVFNLHLFVKILCWSPSACLTLPVLCQALDDAIWSLMFLSYP